MANELGAWYDPLFYAQEALIQLNETLGMARTVHRGFDRTPQTKGSTIQIRRPTSFTAQDAPSSAQDINPDDVTMTLNKWREVKFFLTDKDLTLSQDVIIEDHIRPMAAELARDIDENLNSLYVDVPWQQDVSSPAAAADITAAWRQLFDNKAPQGDGRMWLELDGTLTAEFLNLAAFAQQQGSGDAGVATQISGSLGQRYGFNIFSNQNVKTHTTGVSADATGTLNGNVAAGATSIAVSAVTGGGTFKAGDHLVIAGNTQRYAITADAAADSGGNVTLSITPNAVQAYDSGAVVTITLESGTMALAYHRNAFALAMAPLSMMANELGARIESVTDPITGLSLRSRVYYDGDNSRVNVALDVLYGVKTLDPNLAVRLRNA